jgi:hypothetical protein
MTTDEPIEPGAVVIDAHGRGWVSDGDLTDPDGLRWATFTEPGGFIVWSRWDQLHDPQPAVRADQ